MNGSPRPVATAMALAVAALLLGACTDDGGDRPSLDPTRSLSPTAERPSPTRTPTRSSSPEESESAPEPSPSPSAEPSEPTESAAPTESAEPTQDPTQEETQEPSRTASASAGAGAPTTASTVSTAPSSEATSESSSEAGDDTDTSEVPTGVWWLLAAVLIGLAVAIPLIVRSRKQKAWQSDLAGATAEVAWLARELVPELARTGSRAQAAGGWAVSAERTRLLQERLTVLEATAPDDAGRAHARTLHDAVRAARESLRTLDSDRPDASLRPQLARIASDLEIALRSVGSDPPPPAT